VAELISTQSTLFTYESLPEADATWLRAQEEKIIGYCRKTLADHVAVGQILIDVHTRLPRRFKEWLEATNTISRSTAYNLMDVAEKFAETIRKEVSTGRTQSIDVKALYELSKERVPAECRVLALKQAEQGIVTVESVKDIIRDAKAGKKKHTQRDWVQEYAEKYERKFKGEYETLRGDIFDETKTPPPNDSREARAIRGLEDLCRLTTALSFGTVEDSEDGSELFSIRGVFKSKDRQMPPAAVRADIIDAIEALLGREEMKECPQCVASGNPKTKHPISWFTQNRTKGDGRASECKDCSRRRIREAKKRRLLPPAAAA